MGTVLQLPLPLSGDQPLKRGEREPLPNRRGSFTQKAEIAGNSVLLGVGEYPDGRPGEIFVSLHKEGAAFRSLMNCMAIVTSIALQFGVPLQVLVDSLAGFRFEPSGPVEAEDSKVKSCLSIVDYIFRELASTYLASPDSGQAPGPVA